MDLMTLIASVPGIGHLLPYVPVLVAVASGVATALPAPAAGASGAYSGFYAVTNWIALNFGHAKNAPAATPPTQTK